jgi:hypothetical protein
LAIVVAVSFSTFSPAWAVEDDYADEAFRQAVAYQASSAVDAAILKTGPAYGLSNPGEYQKKGLRKGSPLAKQKQPKIGTLYRLLTLTG